jgi:two-component system, NtrC family, sensor kinase
LAGVQPAYCAASRSGRTQAVAGSISTPEQLFFACRLAQGEDNDGASFGTDGSNDEEGEGATPPHEALLCRCHCERLLPASPPGSASLRVPVRRMSSPPLFPRIASTTVDRPGGLRSALLMAVVSAIVVPAVLLGYIFVDHTYNRTLTQEHAQKAEKYADLLQAGMIQPLWDFAPESGRQLLKGASVDPSVVRITVRDDSNTLFLEYRNPRQPDETGAITLRRRVHAENTDIGTIEFVYSVNAATEQARMLSWQLAGVILIQIFCSVVVLFLFLNHRVLRPILALERAAAALSESGLDAPVPPGGRDEIGSLARQFGLMRDSLKRTFDQLENEISERTRANEEIRSLNENLEGRVQNRTLELIEANAALERTLEDLRHAQHTLVQTEKLASLGSLVAGVAHELNTPIGNGLAAASTMEDESILFRERVQQGIRRSELEHYVEVTAEGSRLVRVSLQRAAELVGSFKQVAVDQIGSQRRHFDLAEVVHETIVTVSPTLRRTRHHLIQDIPEGIRLDSYPGPLGQVILNLFNNALTHAFEGRDDGVIRIRAHETEAESVRIEFADNGRGIPPAALDHIYDPFFTTKLGQGGSGLGMHIVHTIVTAALGGEIHVVSQEGRGTTFTVIIPLKAP